MLDFLVGQLQSAVSAVALRKIDVPGTQEDAEEQPRIKKRERQTEHPPVGGEYRYDDANPLQGPEFRVAEEREETGGVNKKTDSASVPRREQNAQGHESGDAEELPALLDPEKRKVEYEEN